MSKIETEIKVTYFGYTTKTTFNVKGTDIRHREDGPAYILSENGIILTERWCINGKPHRLDGPAVCCYHCDEYVYYISGVRYTKEEYEEYIRGIPSKQDLELLADLGQTF